MNIKYTLDEKTLASYVVAGKDKIKAGKMHSISVPDIAIESEEEFSM